MLVPLIVMAFGVTLFVGYGAIQSITGDDTNPATQTGTATTADNVGN